MTGFLLALTWALVIVALVWPADWLPAKAGSAVKVVRAWLVALWARK